MPQPEAVIFDLDDTLFDHRGAAAAALARWLTEIGVEPTPELEALWFDAENRHVAAWTRGEVSFEEQRRRRLREVLAAADRLDGASDGELDEIFAAWAGHYRSSWRVFEDTEQALALVAGAGLKHAILTNGAETQQHQKLAAVGLSDRVGPVFCCDALGFGKPDPRAYQAVCDALGVPYDRVLHVGDRHDYDLVGAQEAGLAAIHLDRRDACADTDCSRILSLRELSQHLGVRSL